MRRRNELGVSVVDGGGLVDSATAASRRGGAPRATWRSRSSASTRGSPSCRAAIPGCRSCSAARHRAVRLASRSPSGCRGAASRCARRSGGVELVLRGERFDRPADELRAPRAVHRAASNDQRRWTCGARSTRRLASSPGCRAPRPGRSAAWPAPVRPRRTCRRCRGRDRCWSWTAHCCPRPVARRAAGCPHRCRPGAVRPCGWSPTRPRRSSAPAASCRSCSGRGARRPRSDAAGAYLEAEPAHLAAAVAELRLAGAEAALADPQPAAPAGVVAARIRRGVAIVVDGELPRSAHVPPAGRWPRGSPRPTPAAG